MLHFLTSQLPQVFKFHDFATLQLPKFLIQPLSKGEVPF